MRKTFFFVKNIYIPCNLSYGLLASTFSKFFPLPVLGVIQPMNAYLGQNLPQIRCQNVEAPSTSPAGSTDTNPLPQPMSPDDIKVEQPEGDGHHNVDHDAQPMQTCQLSSSPSPLPPLPPPPPGPGKLIRRFSEQVCSQGVGMERG